MGSLSRTKGAAGERELSKLLEQHLGIKFNRNLEQTRDGGHDLNGLSALSIECKRAAQPSFAAWWDQTTRQALEAGRVPILAYRIDRRQWAFMVALSDFVAGCEHQGRGLEMTATMAVEGFALLVRERWMQWKK